MPKDCSQLVLGTAQLGGRYGIANVSPIPDKIIAKEIVKRALNFGIMEFDTASGYGKSERLLGQAFADAGVSKRVRVITKLDPTVDHTNRKAMFRALDESLKNLRVPRLFAVLMHRENRVELWEKGLGEIAKEFVSSGKAEQIGISLYTPQMAKTVMEIAEMRIIQLPANVLDRRFAKEGVFAEAKKFGKRIYARSIFLQGLILMPSKNLPLEMSYATKTIEKLEQLSRELHLSVRELSLR